MGQWLTHWTRRSLPLQHGLPRRQQRARPAVSGLRARTDQEFHDLAVGAVCQLQVRPRRSARAGRQRHLAGLELLLVVLEQRRRQQGGDRGPEGQGEGADWWE
jgi:hypothetical protein